MAEIDSAGIDTQIENALSRAQAASAYTADQFAALITDLIFRTLPQPETFDATPAFTGTDLVPPPDPDNYVVESMRQLVMNATTSFINTYFPEEPEVTAAGAAAKSWMAGAINGTNTAVTGSYMSGITSYFAFSDDTHPDYIPSPLDTHLNDYVSTVYNYARSVVDADVAADLREFSFGIRFQNRGEALRSVANYVIEASNLDQVAGENQARINRAEATMETAIGRWMEAQVGGNLEWAVEMAKADKETAQDIYRENVLYSQVEARVKGAMQGSQVLLNIMKAAYNAINSVATATKLGL